MIRPLLLTVAAAFLFSGCQFSLLKDLSLDTLDSPNPYITEAIKRNPSNFHAWFLLGKENLESSKGEEALAAFRKAKALKPAFEEASIGIAMSYLQLKRWKSAEDEFRELLTRNPNSPEALEGLAIALLEQKKDDEAKINAERALEIDPALPRAHVVLGRLAYAQLDYKTAERHWREALALGAPPQDLEPLYQDLRRMLVKYGD